MLRSPRILIVSIAPFACGGQTAEPQSPAPEPPAKEPGAKSLSPEDCQALSGEVLYDKGDGSLQAEGCPNGRAQLGMVQNGGLCCALSGAAPAEQPTAKRTPCTLGADQTCNEDPKASALWGKCTEQGVCVCNPGFELSPGGYCRPAE